jgi:hypothetical protein
MKSESGSLSARESDESVHERLYRMGGKDEVLSKLKGLEIELDRDCTFKVRPATALLQPCYTRDVTHTHASSVPPSFPPHAAKA